MSRKHGTKQRDEKKQFLKSKEISSYVLSIIHFFPAFTASKTERRGNKKKKVPPLKQAVFFFSPFPSRRFVIIDIAVTSDYATQLYFETWIIRLRLYKLDTHKSHYRNVQTLLYRVDLSFAQNRIKFHNELVTFEVRDIFHQIFNEFV